MNPIFRVSANANTRSRVIMQAQADDAAEEATVVEVTSEETKEGTDTVAEDKPAETQAEDKPAETQARKTEEVPQLSEVDRETIEEHQALVKE